MKFGKVNIGSLFPLTMAMLIVLCGEKLFLSVVSAAVLHEAGHLCAIKFFGGTIAEMQFNGTGISIEYALPRESYGKEIVIIAAGPAAGALAVFAAAVADLPMLAGSSAVLTAFNILPAAMMDGGRLVYLTVSCIWGTQRAEAVVLISSCAVSIFLTAFGIMLLKAGSGSFTTLMAGVWIFCVSVLRCCKKGIHGV